MHSRWKKWRHGMVLISCSSSYSTKQTRHLFQSSSSAAFVTYLFSSSFVMFLMGSVSNIAFGVVLLYPIFYKPDDENISILSWPCPCLYSGTPYTRSP